MANAALTLKSLLTPSKAVEVEFPGFSGFKLNLAFLSRETLVGIRKASTKVTYKNGRQSSDEVDDKQFLEKYVAAAVKGWSGLKLEYVNQLAPIDITGQDPESLLEYTHDNALSLMQSSAAFDSFVSETVVDLGNFTKTSTAK